MSSRGRRVAVVSSTLNERFTNLKRPNSNAFNSGLVARRVATTDRGAQSRFNTVMLRRTGSAPRSTLPPPALRGRVRRGGFGGRGGGRGGFASNTRSASITTFRRSSFGRGRGGRGGFRGRGSRGRNNVNVSRVDLDKDLDSYMGGSKKALDSELDQMQLDRSAN